LQCPTGSFEQATGHLIIYVSDNESWIDTARPWVGNLATETMNQWSRFKKRNRKAKMVCIDIQPSGTTQTKESADIVNVGGFSDHVFKLIADIANSRFCEGHWMNEIEKVSL